MQSVFMYRNVVNETPQTETARPKSLFRSEAANNADHTTGPVDDCFASNRAPRRRGPALCLLDYANLH